MPDPVTSDDNHSFARPDIEAFYRLVAARRDVRNGFRPDPVSDDLLTRVLAAAHQAPSVGLSQPWDFIVLRDRATRARIQALARTQQALFAASLPRSRALAFSTLKVEAILDAPVSIVVTCDPTRGGRHVLGRHAQPQVAVYSSVCAVQNLWLAARAEGLGVGWVSFFDERELAAALELPAHLDVVAYLCVGHVEAFPPGPELALSGWARQRPLAGAVHDGRWGRRGLPGAEPARLLSDTIAAIGPPDGAAIAAARERQERLTKPSGSLGVLEDLSAQLAGLAGECPPPLPEPAVVAVFAGDHGVHAQGVTPWPQEVTAQMVANFLASGAVINAIAAQAGAEVCVVDVGVIADFPPTPGLLPRKVRRGTADMTTGAAMSGAEARAAIEVGIETARELVAAGNRCLVTGDMGIANTTASAALVSVFTGADPGAVTGRGTGVDDETWARKVDVVRRALARHRPDSADPVGALAAVGGLEHAALAGFLIGAAALRVPVVLDGLIACAAALAAHALAPNVVHCMVAGHLSTEPGARRALATLSLRPLLDLDLRLGEGSGGALALPIVQSAARVLRDVATFDSAGVSAAKPEETAGTAPEEPAGTAPEEPAGTAADQRAGTAADQRPGTAADQRPGTAADQRAGTAADQRAGTAADQLAGTAADQRPGTAAGERAGTACPARRVLVLGGARSGKSASAEAILAGQGPVDYIATGPLPGAGDAEWDARVGDHRERRPEHWRTQQTLDLERVLAAPGTIVPVLVDCLSTWLARVMDDCGVWSGQPGADQELAARVDRLVAAWQAARRPAVAVSNEVGSGIVPATASGRRYRDELGRLNARIAAGSSEVWLCTAGIAQRLR